MKVIFSVDSVKFPLTGIGRYTYELAKNLQSRTDIELLLMSNGKLGAEWLAQASGSESKQAASGLKSWLEKHLRKNYVAVEVFQAIKNLKSQLALHSHHDAVFHSPNYYLPELDGPSVATFHDLSMFTFTQYHPPERVRFMQRQLKLTLERASMLITDSDYTKQELSSYLGYPIEKIRAIPLACSQEFHPRNEQEASPVLKRHGLLYGSYTLFTGTVEPRKNLDALLDAYAALPADVRMQWPLVVAGYHGWQSEKLHERIKLAAAAGWLRYLGFVADEDLPYLYAGARLFVFPSHYEGFGLPVLEAMASGVPVVCSNSSSLPEVVGCAALTCGPDDVDALRQLISRGLEDNDWRADTVVKGLQRVEDFSWEKCAEQTIAVYRELYSQSNV